MLKKLVSLNLAVLLLIGLLTIGAAADGGAASSSTGDNDFRYANINYGEGDTPRNVTFTPSSGSDLFFLNYFGYSEDSGYVITSFKDSDARNMLSAALYPGSSSAMTRTTQLSFMLRLLKLLLRR